MSETDQFAVRKIGVHVKLSTEQALMYGWITEDEARAQGWAPPPPPTRRQRLRYWWWDHKPHLHMHLGSCNHVEDE